MIMKHPEEKLIEKLNYHKTDHTPILIPHLHFKGKYQPSFFYVDDHTDLLLTVRALIYLSMKVIDPESETDDILERNKDEYVQQTLKIANRLLPWGEEALMDHINEFYRAQKTL